MLHYAWVTHTGFLVLVISQFWLKNYYSMNACFSILVLTGTDVRHAWLTCRIDCRSSILYILTEAVDVTNFNHDESTFLTTILLKWANLKQIFCFFISIYYMCALQNHNQKLLIKTHFHKYRRSNHLSWCQYYKHEKFIFTCSAFYWLATETFSILCRLPCKMFYN